MADSSIQLPPDSTGKLVRAFSGTVGGNTVHEQAFVVCDANMNVVALLNTNPAGTEYAIPVRNIPSGTQAVSGTVTASQGGAPWADNVSQFGGNPVVTGTGTGGAGVPRVTVSSDSFPATQAVSGAVSVSNFPATQPVSGTVGVNNFPATQPVSAATLPLPAGAAQDSTVQTLDADVKARLPTISAPIGAAQLVVQDVAVRRWMETAALELRQISVQLAQLTGVPALGDIGDV